MTTPFHHFKNPYRSIGVGKPDSCSFGEFYGWLGSGIKDKNRVEIYEGDILEIDMTPNQPLPIFYHAAVTFEQGSFKVKEKPLNEFSPSQLEVVGHIAEDIKP